MGFTKAVTQAIWLTKYLNEIGLPAQTPIEIHADNSRSIANTMNDKNHHRTKYIDVKHHFIKERIKVGEVVFKYIPSKENLVDMLTKPLAREATRKINKELGLQRNIKPGGVFDLGQPSSNIQGIMPKAGY